MTNETKHTPEAELCRRDTEGRWQRIAALQPAENPRGDLRCRSTGHMRPERNCWRLLELVGACEEHNSRQDSPKPHAVFVRQIARRHRQSSRRGRQGGGMSQA